MNKFVPLNQVAKYSKKRIKSIEANIDSFITTDNILPNKAGITVATNLPPSGNAMPAYEVDNILVANIRPYLKKIWFANRSGACSADVLVFEVAKSCDPKFIYYSLFVDDFFKHMMRGAKGTKMPRGTKSQILDFLVPDIHLKNQQKISSVLSALDSKIQLNKKINAELEQAAKTLFDYWFVQFEFPNAKGMPYKASSGKMIWNEKLKVEIPDGWSNGVLSDVGKIIGGSTPAREMDNYFAASGTAWITPKDLASNGENKFITKGEVSVSEEGIKSASLNLMPKGTILLSSRAPIGYMAISREVVTTNQGFKSFVPKAGYSTPFVFYAVKNSLPAIVSNASGSTFKEVSGSVLKTISICLPPLAIIEKYTKIADGIFEKQNKLELENQKLSELRDWLLPMLMNGQIKILNHA
jgi:type I restriction enzyme S subunit